MFNGFIHAVPWNLHDYPAHYASLTAILTCEEVYEVCPENVQPLVIKRERFAGHWCNPEAKESRLEHACVNIDNFTVLVRGGGRPLSERVYCMAITFKMSMQSNESASDFALRGTFLHGNYLHDSEGHSYGHLVIGSFIMTTHPLMYHISCRVFGQISNHPGDSAPLQHRFGAL